MRVLKRHRFAKEEDGSVMLETALMVTILLILLLGIVDMGRALFTENNLVSAARAAARVAAVNQAATGAAFIDSTKRVAKSEFSAYGGSAIDTTKVTVTCAMSADCSTRTGGYVQVTIAYTFNWLLPLTKLLKWTSTSATFHSQATYRYEL